jgi:hypothetical protein
LFKNKKSDQLQKSVSGAEMRCHSFLFRCDEKIHVSLLSRSAPGRQNRQMESDQALKLSQDRGRKEA